MKKLQIFFLIFLFFICYDYSIQAYNQNISHTIATNAIQNNYLKTREVKKLADDLNGCGANKDCKVEKVKEAIKISDENLKKLEQACSGSSSAECETLTQEFYAGKFALVSRAFGLNDKESSMMMDLFKTIAISEEMTLTEMTLTKSAKKIAEALGITDEKAKGFIEAMAAGAAYIFPGKSKSKPKASDGLGSNKNRDSNHSSGKNKNTNIPDNIKNLAKKIDEEKYPSHDRNGGAKYKNKEGHYDSHDSQGNPITYKEYDVNPRPPKGSGQNRDSERIVVGSDGRKYYSNEHYKNPIEIK